MQSSARRVHVRIFDAQTGATGQMANETNNPSDRMNVEISFQTTKRIAEVLGSSDPEVINLIMQRVAADERLLVLLAADEPNEGDIQAIREGLEDVAAGRTLPFSEFDNRLREELGFAPRVKT